MENHISCLALKSSFNCRDGAEELSCTEVNAIHIYKFNLSQKVWQIFEIETQIFEETRDFLLRVKARTLLRTSAHEWLLWFLWLGWWRTTGDVIAVWQGKFMVGWHKSLILNFPKVFKTDIKIVIQAASTCNPTEFNYFWMCFWTLSYLFTCLYVHTVTHFSVLFRTSKLDNIRFNLPCLILKCYYDSFKRSSLPSLLFLWCYHIALGGS